MALQRSPPPSGPPPAHGPSKNPGGSAIRAPVRQQIPSKRERRFATTGTSSSPTAPSTASTATGSPAPGSPTGSMTNVATRCARGLRLRRTGPQLGQRASTASLVPRSALRSRGARLLLRLLQETSRAASVIPDASEDSMCRDRTLSQNLLAHDRPIARGVSSLASEAREESHAAGASGLRATCYALREGPAPSAHRPAARPKGLDREPGPSLRASLPRRAPPPSVTSGDFARRERNP